MSNGDGCENNCKKTVLVKYTAVGPQLNVPVANLTGWTICFKETFAVTGTPVANVLAACNKPNLMLACRPVNAASFNLLAHAPRVSVITDTGQSNNPTNANGSGWYFNNSWSWGFARQGDALSRNSCDTGNTNPDLRMCIHTTNTTTQFGYRCGNTFLNNNASWERVILHAD
jgi:hypothetical protein